jgi:DNA-binding NtrC family response regulator
MKTVLLADDDKSVRKMVARVLEIAGYLPLLAASAKEAVLVFQSARPDVVVLDLTRPDQDGWQAFEHMVWMDPLMPVIVITAHSDRSEQPLTGGICSFMEKPLDLTHLLQTIARLLDYSERERTRRLATHSSTKQEVAGV